MLCIDVPTCMTVYSEYNSTQTVFNIDHIGEQLEDAFGMHQCTTTSIVVVVLVTMGCCIFQALFFIAFSPIVLAISGKNKRAVQDRLLKANAENNCDVEIAAAGELGVPLPPPRSKKHVKMNLYPKPKSDTVARHSSRRASNMISGADIDDMEL